MSTVFTRGGASVFWFSLFLSTAFSQQTVNSSRIAISGTVLDAQGKGVSAAHVSLTWQSLSNTVSSPVETTSDLSGHFAFRDVKSGQYRLVVLANGFQNLTRPIDTAQDANRDLTLTLDIAPSKTTVTVQSEREGINVSNAETGSFAPVRLLDLPQSVQVVNRTLLEEQKTYEYADSLSYLAGVQRAYTSIAGGLGNEVAMRGFNLDFSNNYLRDGFKFYGLTLSDTADIEQVEVLKGPASALYGTAEAGGVVNLITKKPTETPYVALSMTGGNNQFLRPDFDISGPVNPGKTLFYRVNGVYEATDSFRTYIHSEKEFVAPYFLWRPSSSTSLAVSGEFVNVNRVSDYGAVLLGDRPAPVSVSTNYTEPWNNEEDRDRQIGYRFTHTFGSRWTLYNGFQLSRTNARYLEVYTTGPETSDPTVLTRLSDEFYFPTLYRYSQTNLVGNVTTGAITQHIAAGFEAGWTTASSLGPGGYAPNVSVLNPAVGADFTESQAVAALANPFFNLTYKTVNHNQSFYAQDQVDLGRHWHAIAGLRVERFFQDAIDLDGNTQQTRKDFPVSPRFGLVYAPKAWLSLYGSYVRSFIPASPSALNLAGQQFSPEHDHQWEAGMKLTSFADRIMGTVALFQIEKQNILAADPTNPIFSVQNGKERSKGVEVEFRGSPVKGLNLLTSYAFIQAQVTQSTVYPVGAILPNAPRNSGAAWATYQAPTGPLRNLGLSAGAIATASREDNFYNTALLPGYVRLDLGAYYDIRLVERQKLRFSVNIQNALDRTYYLASNGQDQIRPGAPTTALGSVRWTWQ